MCFFALGCTFILGFSLFTELQYSRQAFLNTFKAELRSEKIKWISEQFVGFSEISKFPKCDLKFRKIHEFKEFSPKINNFLNLTRF